jgi:16S rRNA (uracil1498-N3)-methyltransferase
VTPHFFVPALEVGDVRLSEADTRHALRSLRLRAGDDVTLADGKGTLGRGRVSGDDRGRAVVAVEDVSRVVRPAPMASVAFPPPKGSRLTWAVQKLAEIGVDEAVLIETERSVRGWRDERAGRALSRLRSVAREAAMQSRQAFVLDIRTGQSLDELLGEGTFVTVMLWERATASLTAGLPPEAGGVRVLVGPEGGFSDAEADLVSRSGGHVASLGESVLRTETAAVVGAALVLAHYGRLG